MDVPVKCELCPRRCGVDRSAGKTGYCRAGKDLEIYRFGTHHGEEPPISLVRGSGTVFFSRCTLSCVYCQNFPWSQEGSGEKSSAEGLKQMLLALHEAGCHNWNFVSPTPWLPWIRDAVEKLKNCGILLPVVYNTSGFESVETLSACRDLVSVYLTDLRYASVGSAKTGSGAVGYVEAARAALLEMWAQKGPLKLNAEGAAVEGTICRVLVLPGRANEAVESLEWLAAEVGDKIAVSLMSQYTPAYKAKEMKPWSRQITAEEYDTVRDAMERLGFTEGWMQDLEETTAKELIGFEMKSGPDLK